MSSILVVTHDGDLRATAARALATAGWKVMTAAHAGHASLACAKGGPFDVLVVEDEMPDASGLALALRLRRYCPGLQVVRLCRRPSQFGDGIAVARPFFADALVDAVLRAACAIPQA